MFMSNESKMFMSDYNCIRIDLVASIEKLKPSVATQNSSNCLGGISFEKFLLVFKHHPKVHIKPVCLAVQDSPTVSQPVGN